MNFSNKQRVMSNKRRASLAGAEFLFAFYLVSFTGEAGGLV